MGIPGLQGMRPGQLLRAVARTAVREDLTSLAAQLAYYGLLALFPFGIFLVTLLGFLPIAGLTDEIFRILRVVMPRDAAELVVRTIGEVVSVQRERLLALSLAGSVFTASIGVSAFIDVLDRAYGVPETRSWIRRQLMSIALTVLSALMVTVATAALLLGPDFGHRVSAWFGLESAFDSAWRLLRWPTIVLAMSLMLAFLYWACPNIKQRFKYITPGSVLSILLWIGASLGFSTYVDVLGNYNRTYGALGAGIVLLVWIYLSGLIVLLGGVLNAVIWCHAHPGESRGRACDTGERER